MPEVKERAATFADVHLEWDGKKYVIPPARMLNVICAIERHITLGELAAMADRRTLALGSLSAAYGVALRYAGANEVTDEDVYLELVSSRLARALPIVDCLLSILIPKKPDLGPAPKTKGDRE